MSDDLKTHDISFIQGFRQEALRKALEIVKASGRSAELVICRDIPGHHEGGEECFCDPKIMQINPEELE